jgi:hypothetical protein
MQNIRYRVQVTHELISEMGPEMTPHDESWKFVRRHLINAQILCSYVATGK